MLKIESCKEYTSIETKGTLIEITADVTRALAHLHASLYSDDPKSADAFKHVIQKAVMDENSPVWSLIFLPDVERREPTTQKRVKQFLLLLKSIERKMK